MSAQASPVKATEPVKARCTITIEVDPATKHARCGIQHDPRVPPALVLQMLEKVAFQFIAAQQAQARQEPGIQLATMAEVPRWAGSLKKR